MVAASFLTFSGGKALCMKLLLLDGGTLPNEYPQAYRESPVSVSRRQAERTPTILKPHTQQKNIQN